MNNETTPETPTYIHMTEEFFNEKLKNLPVADLTLAQWESERTKRIQSYASLAVALSNNKTENVGYSSSSNSYSRMQTVMDWIQNTITEDMPKVIR